MKQLVTFFFVTLSLLLSAQPDQGYPPLIWLRADSTNLELPYWENIHSNTLHAYPVSGTMPEDFVSCNFNRTIPVAWGEHFKISSLNIKGNTITAIIAYKTGNTNTEQGLWSFLLPGNRRVGLTTHQIKNETDTIVYANGNKDGVVINSLTQSWKTKGKKRTSGDLYIGLCDSLFFSGEIAEFILFEGFIPDTLLIRYISYLSIKYGTTLYQTNYLNSEKEVIWSNENIEDPHAVIGVGKDSLFALNQKQSTLQGRVTLGVGTKALANDLNEAVINEKDFLIYGFDSTTFDYSQILNMNTGENVTIYGQGIVQASGATSSGLATFIEVDASSWNGEAEDYALMIERTDNDFSNLEDMDIYLPDVVDTNGILYFSGIYWNKYGQGKERFGFIYFPDSAFVENTGQQYIDESITITEENSGNVLDLNKEGLYDISNRNKYQLYPNPNHGKFNLAIQYVDRSDVRVRIYNPEGKLLKILEGKGEKEYFFNDFFPVKGSYLIEIQGASEKKAFKMLVQ